MMKINIQHRYFTEEEKRSNSKDTMITVLSYLQFHTLETADKFLPVPS